MRYLHPRLSPGPLVAALLFATLWVPAGAVSYTGEVTFASDYVWRGVSQTGGDPSVQGALEFEAGVGGLSVFWGLWGSNVNLQSANLELDPYVGINIGLNDDLGLTVKATQYTYYGDTSGEEPDFTEISAKLALPIIDVYAASSDNYLGSGSSAVWTKADVSLSLFNFGLEYTSADGPITKVTNLAGETTEEIDSYLTAFAGLDYEFIGLNLRAHLFVTDLEKESDLCRSVAGDACGTRAVLSLSRFF